MATTAMDAPTLDAPLLTLSDIALLARVQRPVVTTWRSRASQSAAPFPTARRTVGGQELFDCAEVVDWLSQTGRGNNPDPAADAVAFTLSAAEAVTDTTMYAGLSALLCLQRIAGTLPEDPDDLLDLADEIDSNDLFLYQEVEALGARITATSRYATLLTHAAFDPAEPFEMLRKQRQRAINLPVHSVAPVLKKLLADLAWATADQAGFADPIFVLPSAAEVELLIMIAAHADRRGAVLAALARSDDAELRDARRRLRVHDVATVDLERDEDGYHLTAPSIVLVRTPGTSDPTNGLADLSHLSLNLSSQQRALIVGPSAALIDELPRAGARPGRPGSDESSSEAVLHRRDVIRTGLLRAAVRLPQNLLPDHPRAHAALWCLGTPADEPTAKTRSLVGEIVTSLDEATSQQLIVDLIAGLDGPRQARGRELQHTTFRPTAELQLSDRALFRASPRTTGPQRAVEAVERLLELREVATASLAGLETFAINPGQPTGTPRTTTLEAAISARQLRWVPGARLDPADSGDDTSGVPVILAPDQVRKPTRWMDRLRQASGYPGSQLTLPGDIVVATSPRPLAVVDHEGGAMVCFPARVLRCRIDDGAFTPEAVAADINALPPTAKRWNTWALRLVPRDQLSAVATVLDNIAQLRSTATQRLADLEALTASLLQASSSGTATIRPSTTNPNDSHTVFTSDDSTREG